MSNVIAFGRRASDRTWVVLDAGRGACAIRSARPGATFENPVLAALATRADALSWFLTAADLKRLIHIDGYEGGGSPPG